MARRKRTTQDTQSVGGVPMTAKHMKRRKPINTDLLLDIQPLRKGHVLVIPKVEVDNIFDIEDELLGEMMIFSKSETNYL
jgi:diadenosine tetraphosphate (Ap4A) HIT family hydrolase